MAYSGKKEIFKYSQPHTSTDSQLGFTQPSKAKEETIKLDENIRAVFQSSSLKLSSALPLRRETSKALQGLCQQIAAACHELGPG